MRSCFVRVSWYQRDSRQRKRPRSQRRRETTVNASNSNWVLNHRWVLRNVRSVWNHHTPSDTESEEDLTASFRPHCNWRKLLTEVNRLIINIAFKIHSETVVTIFQSETVHHHDENKHDWKWHSNPNNVAGDLNTLESSEEADNPSKHSAQENLPLEDRSISKFLALVVNGAIFIN